MLEYLKAVIFGIVEGITEWLPVSSTGHLILLEEFLHLDVTEEFYELFQVVIQVAQGVFLDGRAFGAQPLPVVTELTDDLVAFVADGVRGLAQIVP